MANLRFEVHLLPSLPPTAAARCSGNVACVLGWTHLWCEYLVPSRPTRQAARARIEGRPWKPSVKTSEERFETKMPADMFIKGKVVRIGAVVHYIHVYTSRNTGRVWLTPLGIRELWTKGLYHGEYQRVSDKTNVKSNNLREKHFTQRSLVKTTYVHQSKTIQNK